MSLKNKIKFILITTLILILAIELILRCIGFSAYTFDEISLLKCRNKNWEFDKVLGFKHKTEPNACKIEGLNFTVNYCKDSSRRTSECEECNKRKPKIHLYGCSITWGHGINDNETMGWIIQDSLSEYCVYNYGIGAGSTTQSYLWLKKNLEVGNSPQIVIINYSWFHNMRNTFSWPWRKAWQSFIYHGVINEQDTIVKIPVAKMESDSLKIDYLTLAEINHTIPFVKYSALLNSINDIYQSKWVDRYKNDFFSTELLLTKMNELCKRNNIKFLVNAITNDTATLRMLQCLSKKGILTNSIAVDFFKDNTYNLQPYDGHPNYKANKYFANQTIKFLKYRKLVISNSSENE